MDADLDTLCAVFYCTADDLLPEKLRSARRRITNAEVITLLVAQAMLDIPSDRSFLSFAGETCATSSPRFPTRRATTSADAVCLAPWSGSRRYFPARSPVFGSIFYSST